MPSRKALAAVALLVIIVSGGILIGLDSSSPRLVSGPDQSAQLGAANNPSQYAFPGQSSHGSSEVTSTVTAASTVVSTVAGSSTADGAFGPIGIHGPLGTGPTSDSTNPIQSNQAESTATVGVPLASASLGTSQTGDIEFFTNATIRATSAPDAFAQATEIAYSTGGYVAYSTEDNTTALVEMRVPAANYQQALSQVDSLGTVLGQTSSSNDVTVQYTDLNATLQSLMTEQKSLIGILSGSTNINSTLNVESRIQSVDQAINAAESQILQTRTLVSYATISILIEQKAVVQPLSVRLTSTPKSGEAPLSVTFNAVTKGGSEPYVVNYNFGDGTSYEGQSLIHTFQRAGQYNVTVSVTDSSANVTEAWAVVSVSPAPASSSVGTFPGFVAGLFLSVLEGIVEVAVVVLPIAGAVLLVLLPLQKRLGSRHTRSVSEPQPASG